MSGDKEYLNKIQAVVKSHKLDTTFLTYKSFKEKFPYLNISESDGAVHEFKNAGYISPRNMVSAQIKQMKSNGGTHIAEVVNAVTRAVNDGIYLMCATTHTNKQIWAKKILLTTGAFTGFRNLLPSGLQLDVDLRPLTVAKVEISEADFRKISTMSSMIYTGKGADNWTREFPHTDIGYSWYMLPPVKYPNGKYYIKLGHFHDATSKRFTTSKEVKEWFCQTGDNQGLVRSTAELINNIVKGVNMVSYHGDWCVITETPTNRPYIDTVHSQLGVAVGGNGYAAKSSDEIGRIAAAMMVKNEWTTSIPKDVFKIKFKTALSKI